MHDYYSLYRNSKDPIRYREEIVKYAQKNGIKPAARKCKTTPKTVRKWVKRFEEHKKPGLRDLSKKPKNSPNKMIPFWRFKIEGICDKAKKRNKRINAEMIRKKYKIPYSRNTILKRMKEIGFLPQKRKKYQRKRDLREQKAKMRAFEKIQVDIKYLDDIPEMYPEFIAYRLPQYQITARDVSTGALFYSYALEKSSTNTTLFILELCAHLTKYGVNVKEIKFQTDNGTEFTTPWNSILDSAFTKAIERLYEAEHRRIPPGAKTWQSEVETSHRLIEEEFYACEYFDSRKDFFKKAAEYQKLFNLDRHNSYKGASPKELLNERATNIDPNILIFKPVLIDTYYRKYKDIFIALNQEILVS